MRSLIGFHNVLVTLSGIFQISNAIFLPPSLTGLLPVGIISYEVNNTSTDPPRDLMISIFYPASPNRLSNYPLTPAFGPQTNNYTDAWLSTPPGAASNVSLLAHNSAPISVTHEKSPVIFFSPGYGNSRVYYSGAAQNLASDGYIVVTMDHPGDSDFIEYPDGRIATYDEGNDNITAEELVPFVERRVSDIKFILDDLSTSHGKKRIPGLKGRLQLDKVGATGHSLGGATAAALMLNDSRFTAGINMDGSMIGPVITAGLSSPFLLLANSRHVREYDESWAVFYSSLRGWKRDIRVNNTEHHHFADTLYLTNELRANGDPGNQGFMRGAKMFGIEDALLKGFFDMWFKGGKGRLLDGPVKEFPELIFDWCGCVDVEGGCPCLDPVSV